VQSSEDADGQLIVPQKPVGSLVGRAMISVAPRSTLRSAIKKLVDGDVGVIVVRDGDDLKGIFSERDVIDAVHEREDLDVVMVDDIMQPDIITVEPSMSVVDAGRTMIDRGVRHLVVEGPEGGVVSIRAIMRSMLE
jgi:predicted transcriptional regulator